MVTTNQGLPARTHERAEADRKAFVSNLEGLIKNHERGALAHLRRGAGMRPAQAVDVYPDVYRLMPVGVADDELDTYVLVAALFALYYQGKADIARSERPWEDLGASLARLKAGKDSDSLEKRFVTLLKCSNDELPMHLRHAVMLLRTSETPIPINWVVLMNDVERWGDPDRRVQQRWARSYWRSRQPTAASSTAGQELEQQNNDDTGDAGDDE